MPVYHQNPENDSPEQIQRRPYQALSCSLLHFGPFALYCNPGILADDLSTLTTEGFKVVSFKAGE